MIQLQLNISDVDYDALIDAYLPQMTEKLRETGNPIGMLLSNGMPASMAKNILHSLSQENKDALAAQLINANAAKLTGKAEEFLCQQGFPMTLETVQAVVK